MGGIGSHDGRQSIYRAQSGTTPAQPEARPLERCPPNAAEAAGLAHAAPAPVKSASCTACAILTICPKLDQIRVDVGVSQSRLMLGTRPRPMADPDRCDYAPILTGRRDMPRPLSLTTATLGVVLVLALLAAPSQATAGQAHHY